MNILFTAKGLEWSAMMDERFGRAEYLLVYDDEKDEFSHFDNRAMAGQAHGAGPKTAQKLFDLRADVLITGNGPGGNAAVVLKKTGVKIYIGAAEMTIKQAYEAWKNNALEKFND